MSGTYGLLIGPFEAFGFMRTALVACLALALANGPLGVLLLLRRMSLEGNVLAYAVMPGAALGFLYAGYSLAALALGGLLTGALVALSSGLIARLQPGRKEASLAAFYLVSLASGVMIVSARGSNADLMHVLFGTVLAVDVKALLFIATVTSATLLSIAAVYRPLAVASFDRSFLHVVGGDSWVFRGTFFLLLLLNLVASIQAFGTLLAIGPMLLPAAAATCWTRKIWQMIVLNIVFGLSAAYVGLLLSYHANIPSGPSIVLSHGIIYGLSLVAADRARLRRQTVEGGQ